MLTLSPSIFKAYDIRGIIGKTLDGEITNWNAAAQRMFGYSEEQAVGHNIEMLIPPELHAEEAHILAEVSHGRPVPPFDTVRLTRSGERLDGREEDQ